MSEDRAVVAVLGDGPSCPPELAGPLADADLQAAASVRFTDEAGLADAVDGAQVLLLWDFFSPALARVWPRCSALRWVHVAAAGVDAVLFDELRASEVALTNARGTFDRPIAEFVLGAVLAHAKRLHESHDLQRAHVWRHRETWSVRGQRAMVIGVGAIGRETARLLRGVGMHVSGAGRTARDGDPDFDTVVASAELAGHVADVDYLVNAAPLTPQTTGLVDADVLAALPPRAHLVNVGRGAGVVEADLVRALRAGELDGASLDVFESEPLATDSVLWDLPGVVVSAHMSGDVVGWRDTLAEQFTTNLRRWLDGEPLANVVDKELGYVPRTPR